MLSQLTGFLSHALVAKDKDNGAAERGGEMPFDEVFRSVRNESRSSGDDSLPEADAEPRLEEVSAADPSSAEAIEVGRNEAFAEEEEDVEDLPGLPDHDDGQEAQSGAPFPGKQDGPAHRDGELGAGLVTKDDNASTMFTTRRSIAPNNAVATEVSARGAAASMGGVQPAHVAAPISADVPHIQRIERSTRSEQADTPRMPSYLQDQELAGKDRDPFAVARPGPAPQADSAAQKTRAEFRSVASGTLVRSKAEKSSENEASMPSGRTQDQESPSASRLAETHPQRSVSGGEPRRMKLAHQRVDRPSTSFQVPSASRNQVDIFEPKSAARTVIPGDVEGIGTDVAMPYPRGELTTEPPASRLETNLRSGLDVSLARPGHTAVRARGEVRFSAETSQVRDGRISYGSRLGVPMPAHGTIEGIPDTEVSATPFVDGDAPKARRNTENGAQSKTIAMPSVSAEAAGLAADQTSKDVGEQVEVAFGLRSTARRPASLSDFGHIHQSSRTPQFEPTPEPAREQILLTGGAREAMAHLPDRNSAEPIAAETLRSANNSGQQHEPSAEVGRVVSGEVSATRSTVQGRSEASKDNTLGKPPEGKMATAEAGEDAPSLDPIGKLVSPETRRLPDPQLAKSLPLSENSREKTVQVPGAGQVRSTDTISDSTSEAAPETGAETLAHGVVDGRIDKRETTQVPALVWQRSSLGTAAPQALGHSRAYSDETVQFFRHRPEQTAARLSGAKLQSPTPEPVTHTQRLRRVESGMLRANMNEGTSPQQIGGKIVSAQALPIRSDLLSQRTQPIGSVLSPVPDDGAPEPLEAGLGMLSGEVRASGSASQAPAGTAFHRTETATSVLRQVIEGITTAPDAANDVIELQLRPEELGHLRFRMVQGEHGLLFSISADRPETLDLLRRHVDQLARSLSDLGYGGASFSFGEGGQSNGRGGEAGRGVATDHAVPIDRYQDIETPKMTARGVTPSDGLDIRI